jgi:hypothetical protein
MSWRCHRDRRLNKTHHSQCFARPELSSRSVVFVVASLSWLFLSWLPRTKSLRKATIFFFFLNFWREEKKNRSLSHSLAHTDKKVCRSRAVLCSYLQDISSSSTFFSALYVIWQWKGAHFALISKLLHAKKEENWENRLFIFIRLREKGSCKCSTWSSLQHLFMFLSSLSLIRSSAKCPLFFLFFHA